MDAVADFGLPSLGGGCRRNGSQPPFVREGEEVLLRRSYIPSFWVDGKRTLPVSVAPSSPLWSTLVVQPSLLPVGFVSPSAPPESSTAASFAISTHSSSPPVSAILWVAFALSLAS